MTNAVLAALLFGALSGTARANDNFDCFGMPEAFGRYTGLLNTASKNGPLNVQAVAKEIRGAVAAETANHKLQRLSALAKGQVIPLAEGGFRTMDVRSDVDLAYTDGQLTRLATKSYEEGKPDSIITGRESTFNWKTGACRPSRITVQDHRQLGDKRGVIFDAALCAKLTAGEKGVSLKRAEACVDAGKKALVVLQEFDNELREGNELLVTVNPLQPGIMLPSVQIPENSQALSLMASCVAFEQRPVAPAKDAPAAPSEPAPPEPGKSTAK